MTTAVPRRPAPAVDVRQATPADLQAAARIHAAGDVEMVQRMHPRIGLTLLDETARTESSLASLRDRHDEDPQQVWVAVTEEQRIVGVASGAFRGRHAHIQSFFVVPDAQQHGIGESLLRALHVAGRNAGCQVFTLQASDDPRALTRYFHLGLTPHAPNVVWAAHSPRFPQPGLDNPYERVPLVEGDPSALNTVDDIDKAVRGAQRSGDLRRWLQEGASGALLLNRFSGVPAGYYLASAQGRFGRIGPVAAMDASQFPDVLAIALSAAAALHVQDMVWRIAMPGENRAAITPLLESGFRPSFTMTFFASAPIGRFDRYLFHDLDLL